MELNNAIVYYVIVMDEIIIRLCNCNGPMHLLWGSADIIARLMMS